MTFYCELTSNDTEYIKNLVLPQIEEYTAITEFNLYTNDDYTIIALNPTTIAFLYDNVSESITYYLIKLLNFIVISDFFVG